MADLTTPQKKLLEMRRVASLPEQLDTQLQYLSELSCPPTSDELASFRDLPSVHLPEPYYRAPQDRIYVNRDLRLDKISFIGFDMDYTLAVYKDPEFDALTFQLALKELVRIGYPEGILKLDYDNSYPIRGLLLEPRSGNFLKVDSFGHISKCFHGSREIKKKAISEIYPSMMIDPNNTARFYSIDTLYSVCEAGLYRQLVDFLEPKVELDVSYENLFHDVRTIVDTIHRNGTLKAPIMQDPGKYIHKAPQLKILLERVRKAGMKAFLLTNSDYNYSNCVMSFLLPKEEVGDWKLCFDYMIVSANKPAFFKGGTQLREVDMRTGYLHIGKEPKELLPGRVYSGGSIELFEKLTGARGDKVLYVGDHIFSDVVVSKERHFWRTLLVVRELQKEIQADLDSAQLKLHLKNLEFIRRETMRGLDSTATVAPDLKSTQREVRRTQAELDAKFNVFWGSMFRSGTKHSWFTMICKRYADLYASHFGNLINYPLFYFFGNQESSLAHEDLVL